MRPVAIALIALLIVGCNHNAPSERTLSREEQSFVGRWQARPAAAGPKPFEKRDDSKAMEIEFRKDGTYLTRFFGDDKRTFVAVEIEGKWAAAEGEITLTPERHTLLDKSGNLVSTGEVLGEPTSLHFDTNLGALVPTKTDTSYGRFIFMRGNK